MGSLCLAQDGWWQVSLNTVHYATVLQHGRRRGVHEGCMARLSVFITCPRPIFNTFTDHGVGSTYFYPAGSGSEGDRMVGPSQGWTPPPLPKGLVLEVL